MDNKKDFLADLIEAEEKELSDTDTVDNEETSFEDELNEIGVSDDDSLDYEQEQPSAKKKHFIQVPIIISLVIVAVAALGLFIFKGFFNTSVVGTWMYTEVSSADEASASSEDISIDRYYIFEDDGTLSMVIGTITQKCDYKITYDEENTMFVNMIFDAATTYTYECNISGNMFTGRKLSLVNSEYNQQLDLESAKYKTPEIEHDKDFAPKEELLGKWVYDDGFYTFSFEFNEDGSAQYSEYGTTIADGYYTYTDTEFTFIYYSYKREEMERSYEIVDGSLIVDGIMQFTKQSEASADES